MATQLRRYEVEPGGLERLAAWFPTIVAVREKYGFTVEFAYADEEKNEFIWAVSHPGDFEAALEEYNDSPERTAAFEGFDSPVSTMHVSMVDRVV